MKVLASLISVIALSYAGIASAAPGGSTFANVLFRDNSAAQQGRHDYLDDYRGARHGGHYGNSYGHDNHGHDNDSDHDHDHDGHGNGHSPGHGGGHCRGHHDDFCGPASP